jgi:hypothetical protein
LNKGRNGVKSSTILAGLFVDVVADSIIRSGRTNGTITQPYKKYSSNKTGKLNAVIIGRDKLNKYYVKGE